MRKFVFVAFAALVGVAFGRVGPVSQYGQLQAGKNTYGKGQIYGSCPTYSTSGNEVQVQGMSLFWSIASDVGAPFWTADYVKGLVDRQNIQLIRAPMGVDEDWSSGNYFTNTSYYQGLMNTVVQAAIDNDIYVIIDYHSHSASDNVSNAKTFFATMAQKWGSYDNVIFEIFNEPKTQDWSTIKTYADQVVATIRQYSDNLILVGSRQYDQYPNEAVSNPVTDSKNNTAYTFHFYAGSHYTSNEGANAVTAMNGGLAVFVSEWGTVDYSGNGGFNSSNSATWLSWMNNHKLSGANWSVSNKDESASYFTTAGAWNYSESGQWVNANVLGSNLPTSYTACSGTAASSSSVASSSSTLPEGYTDYIDDFEDGDSLAYTGGIWYAFNDNADGALSTITNTAITDAKGNPGYKVVISADNNTSYMGALTGITLNQGSYTYEPYVALGLKLNEDETAYDLSSCNTISYKYKGAGHNFKAEDTAVEDYAYHYIAKNAASSWTEVSISWDMLNQPSWTTDAVELSQARIAKFTWEVKGDLKGTQPTYNYLYVDDVRCNGIAIKPVVVSSSSSEMSSSSSAEISSSSESSSSTVESSSAEVSSSSEVTPSSSSVTPSTDPESSSSDAIPGSDPESSSEATPSSSSENMFVITGNLEQTIVKGNDFNTVTITGVTDFNRNSYYAYYLNFDNSNGTLTIKGNVPSYATEGTVQEKFTVNGTQLTLTLNVVNPSSSSSEEAPSSSSVTPGTDPESSSSEASSSSTDVIQSSSSVESSSSTEVIQSSDSESSSSEEVPSSSAVESSSSGVIPGTDPESSSSAEQLGLSSSSSDEDWMGIARNVTSMMNIAFADNTLSLSVVNATDVKILVFDMMGHLVASSREMVSGNYSMNLESLSRGKYLVRITSGKVVRTAPVTVR